MYARMKKSLPELYAFTICMWLKSKALAGLGTPFSYSVPSQANEIVLLEWGTNPLELLINDKVSLAAAVAAGGARGGGGLGSPDLHLPCFSPLWEMMLLVTSMWGSWEERPRGGGRRMRRVAHWSRFWEGEASHPYVCRIWGSATVGVHCLLWRGWVYVRVLQQSY